MMLDDASRLIAPVDDAQIDGAVEALSEVDAAHRFDRAELATRLHGARVLFGYQRSVELQERGATRDARDKLQQAIGAGIKLQKLMADPDVTGAMSAAAHRRHRLGDADARSGSDLVYIALALLPALVENMETSLNTPAIGDKREENAIRALIVELAKTFEWAAGVDLAQPTYDPVTAELGGPLYAFLRVTTSDISDVQMKSDEALRHIIRKAFGLGEIRGKKGGSRPFTKAAHAPNCAVTETNKVTDRERKATRSP